MRDAYDVIVIGGGPAGSTAAAVLAQAGWSVAIVEQNAFPRRKVCGEFLSLTNWPVLEQLGLAQSVQSCAGPEVTHMAVLSGSRIVRAELPDSFGRVGKRGRALTRDRLDTLLIDRAKELGAEILQPWKVLSVTRSASGYDCALQARETREKKICSAKLIVAANGSWEASPLPHSLRKQPRPSDLFGFKAHFRNASLDDGLMPLLSFKDGYGGMVHCQDDLTSLSCCVTRARLNRLRDDANAGAGEHVFEHIKQSCPAIIPILENATRVGPWLSAGPLQTGIRRRYADGIFYVGNAAAEAHPVIADGISIAIQSGWLMGTHLAPFKNRLDDRAAINAVGHAYATEWRSAFATRIRASALIAHWAMHPKLVQAALPIFERWPRVLKWFAELAGKASLSFQFNHSLQKAVL